MSEAASKQQFYYGVGRRKSADRAACASTGRGQDHGQPQASRDYFGGRELHRRRWSSRCASPAPPSAST